MDRNYLKQAIESFLNEDIAIGDLTSEAIFPPGQMGAADFVAQGSFVAAGMEKVAGAVFKAVNPEIKVVGAVDDGEVVAPGDILLQIQHLILSHHGEKEYGSPEIPKTKEAFAMHIIDLLDSKLAIFEELDNRSDKNELFSEYSHILGRRILVN